LVQCDWTDGVFDAALAIASANYSISLVRCPCLCFLLARLVIT